MFNYNQPIIGITATSSSGGVNIYTVYKGIFDFESSQPMNPGEYVFVSPTMQLQFKKKRNLRSFDTLIGMVINDTRIIIGKHI